MIGERVNNYVVKSLIGQGGMGSVWLAEHPGIGRRVALKVLRAELAADEAQVARFLNEARAAHAIRHPNIIDVLDAGTLASGAPYIMMELLEGESLATRLARQGRLSVGEAIGIARQTAEALQAAHLAGIVHRDLKPDNLYITPDPLLRGRERVKVLDFGIAKLRHELSGSSLQTATGALMGTPQYMSPEQCRGVSSAVDRRTDVYALGIILYQMLSGAPPFVGEGFGDILMMQMSQAPEPLSLRNPAMPPKLEAAILRALAKKPEERFSDMTELSVALAGLASLPSATLVLDAPPLVPAPLVPATPATTRLLNADSLIQPTRASTTFSTAASELEPPARKLKPPWLLAGALGVAGSVGVIALWVILSPGRPMVDPPERERHAGQPADAGVEPGGVLSHLGPSDAGGTKHPDASPQGNDVKTPPHDTVAQPASHGHNPNPLPKRSPKGRKELPEKQPQTIAPVESPRSNSGPAVIQPAQLQPTPPPTTSGPSPSTPPDPSAADGKGKRGHKW